LSGGFFFIKIFKAEQTNFYMVVKPFVTLSLDHFSGNEASPCCCPNNRIFTIAKPYPMDAERLVRLSRMTAGKNIAFNKNIFSGFHKPFLYRRGKTGMLLFLKG